MYLISKKLIRSMGTYPADQFLTQSGCTYYLDKNGKPVCGWKKIGGEYYYFDRDNGRMSSSGRVDGVKLNKDGTAEKKDQGCCVSEASALAFLFHECGCKTVYVACDTGHAWVELNGRVYDPLFAEAREFSRYYNVPYDGYSLYAVLKRKI